MFKKLWKYLGVFFGASFFACLGAALGSDFSVSWENGASIGAVELVTVVLSALSVILVVLTIFLAVLGFVGLSTINDRLRDHSKNYFNENLKKGQPAFDMVEQVVREVLYRGVDVVDSDETDELGDEEKQND